MNTQLIDRILSLIHAGHRRSVIIEHLVREGYSVDDIEAGFDEVYVSGRAPDEFWEKGIVSPGFSNTAIHSVSDVVVEKEQPSFFGRLARYFVYHKKRVAVWMILGTLLVGGIIVVWVLYTNNPRTVVRDAYEHLLFSPRVSFVFQGDIPGHTIEVSGDIRTFSSGLFSVSVQKSSTTWKGNFLVDEEGSVFMNFDEGIAQDAVSRWIVLEDAYPGGEESLRYLGVYPVLSHMKVLFLLDGVIGDGIFRALNEPGALSIEREEEKDRIGVRVYRVVPSWGLVDTLWFSLIGEGKAFASQVLHQTPWYVYVYDDGTIRRIETVSDTHTLSFTFSYPDRASSYELDVEAVPVSQAAQWVVLP